MSDKSIVGSSKDVVKRLRENAAANARSVDAWRIPPQPLWDEAAELIEAMAAVGVRQKAEIARERGMRLSAERGIVAYRALLSVVERIAGGQFTESGAEEAAKAVLRTVENQNVERLAHETGEQLLWTLEWRASFDGPWTPYYALYPTRAKARAAIMNARGEASDWRTVPLQRVPDPEAPPSKANACTCPGDYPASLGHIASCPKHTG